MDQTETKLIASALYEIRLLFSSYIGTEIDAPADVRFAAHLAYALHNEALALVAGTGFDVHTALNKVAAIDGILGTDDGERLAHSWGAKTKGNA